MITMEFDEIKMIWDSQNEEPLYVMNEKAMHNRILSKKQQAYHITNISELLLIWVNVGAGIFTLGMNLFKGPGNTFLYLMAAWMLCTALYVWVSRLRRVNGEGTFDRSMRGDLDHAVAMANYQVTLSQLMLWNVVPIGILTVLGMLEGGKSWWLAGTLVIFFVLTFYAGRWENNIYKVRKRELEALQSKLGNG